MLVMAPLLLPSPVRRKRPARPDRGGEKIWSRDTPSGWLGGSAARLYSPRLAPRSILGRASREEPMTMRDGVYVYPERDRVVFGRPAVDTLIGEGKRRWLQPWIPAFRACEEIGLLL